MYEVDVDLWWQKGLSLARIYHKGERVGHAILVRDPEKQEYTSDPDAIDGRIDSHDAAIDGKNIYDLVDLKFQDDWKGEFSLP